MQHSPELTAAAIDRKESALDLINGDISALSELLAQLEHRLAPVLQPEFDSPNGPNPGSGSPQAVQSTIRDYHDALCAQCQRVMSILGRLEV